MTFFHLDEFPEFKPLQDNHRMIKDELSRIPRWVQWGSDNPDGNGHCQFQSGEWTVFPAYIGARESWHSFMDIPNVSPALIESVFSRLPNTFPCVTSLLRQMPRVKWCGFSRLAAKSALKTHRHENPASLIYHLGLVIPPNGLAGLMSEDQVHIWDKEGDAVIFDDNHLHSAWNDSDSERIVLYINFAT